MSPSWACKPLRGCEPLKGCKPLKGGCSDDAGRNIARSTQAQPRGKLQLLHGAPATCSEYRMRLSRSPPQIPAALSGHERNDGCETRRLHVVITSPPRLRRRHRHTTATLQPRAILCSEQATLSACSLCTEPGQRTVPPGAPSRVAVPTTAYFCVCVHVTQLLDLACPQCLLPSTGLFSFRVMSRACARKLPCALFVFGRPGSTLH